MLTFKVWTLLLALHLVSSFAVVTAEIDDDASAINDPMVVRHLQVTPEPLWFQRISASFVGVNLQRCSKRSKVPENGAKCSSKKPKNPLPYGKVSFAHPEEPLHPKRATGIW